MRRVKNLRSASTPGDGVERGWFHAVGDFEIPAAEATEEDDFRFVVGPPSWTLVDGNKFSLTGSTILDYGIIGEDLPYSTVTDTDRGFSLFHGRLEVLGDWAQDYVAQIATVANPGEGWQVIPFSVLKSTRTQRVVEFFYPYNTVDDLFRFSTMFVASAWGSDALQSASLSVDLDVTQVFPEFYRPEYIQRLFSMYQSNNPPPFH